MKEIQDNPEYSEKAYTEDWFEWFAISKGYM